MAIGISDLEKATIARAVFEILREDGRITDSENTMFEELCDYFDISNKLIHEVSVKINVDELEEFLGSFKKSLANEVRDWLKKAVYSDRYRYTDDEKETYELLCEWMNVEP